MESPEVQEGRNNAENTGRMLIKNSELAYSSLSPVDNIDREDAYVKALEWAIYNRKKQDIKNIALTGPYGSGKSSVLKTFQKKYHESKKGSFLKNLRGLFSNSNGGTFLDRLKVLFKKDGLHFLNISLATFKDEKSDLEGTRDSKGKDELLRLIEISILQQIFYHEKDKDIPDSRFKRIISFRRAKLLIIASCTILFLFALANLIFPNFVPGIFKDIQFDGTINNILHYGSVLVAASGLGVIIYKSIRIISSFTINKLVFQNAEIGIESDTNKSILNHHLDEILYFFRVRPYNVVIIEDLDRFEETEIFTKLREVNLLLNSSKKTRGNDIVFIYAVRDDMFSDNERIKFFDFLIPIIPVINSYNSSEILLEKMRMYNWKLTDDFIEDIAFFIDDMRLLHNISNEFVLYMNKLDETLNQDKLFAIITYKNIYPNDFVDLSKNKGHLFEIFNSKSIYITHELKRLDGEISKVKEEIRNIESIHIKSVKELRMLYLIRTIEKLDNFISFVVAGRTVSFDEATADDAFQFLVDSKMRCNGFDRLNRSGSFSTTVDFSTIEKSVDPEKSYKQRETEILDSKSGKTNELKNEIRSLEREKIRAKGATLSELFKSENVKLEIPNDLNPELLNVLIRNGYVQEDYHDYVSVFHEESITRADHKFVLNIKNRQALDFDYKLTKVESLIKKINLGDFETEYVFNYDLLNFLLKRNETYSSQLDHLFAKLKDESEASINFIKAFIDVSGEIEHFYKILCAQWPNIWNYVEAKSLFADEDKELIFRHILNYVEVPSIVKIADASNLRQRIIDDPQFLNKVERQDHLEEIVQKLGISFRSLDFESSPPEALEYILKDYTYDLNPDMAKFMILKFGELDSDAFRIANYSAIRKSKCEDFISYVEEFIDEYVENIFLALETNRNELEDSLLILLNNSKINLEKRVAIIKKTETRVTDVSQVEEVELSKVLFIENKVEPSWENLLEDFRNSEYKISKRVIDFVNILENARKLSSTEMPPTVDIGSEEEPEPFEYTSKFILNKEISDETYLILLKSVLVAFTDLEFEYLSKAKVQRLIEYKILEPTIENYTRLKGYFDGLNIAFIEANLDEILALGASLCLDENDLNKILKSRVIEKKMQIDFVNHCSLETISKMPENLGLIAQSLRNDESIKIGDELLEKILLSEKVSIQNRIILFVRRSFASPVFIDRFLIALGKDYEHISDKSKRAKIADNELNRQFLNVLRQSGYISSYSEFTPLFDSPKLRVNHKRK